MYTTVMQYNLWVDGRLYLIVGIVANSFCPGTCKKSPVVCCKRPKSVGKARTRRWRRRRLRRTATFGDALVAVVPCCCASVASGSVARQQIFRNLRTSDRLTVWIRIRRCTWTSGKRLSHRTLLYIMRLL